MQVDTVRQEPGAALGTAARHDELRRPWRRRLPLLPALVFTVLLTQVPFLMNIWYSLTDWTIVPPTSRRYIGLDNYGDLPDDQFFRDAAWVTVVMTVSAVLASLVLGTLLAVLLDRNFFGRGVARTLLGTIYLIQVFDHVAVMTGGGPDSTNIPYFVYQRSIGGGWEFGKASAYSIVVVVASIVVATVALRVLSRLLRGEEIA